MMIKDYFIYKPSGMTDEYEKILTSERHLFKANGANKEALTFLYKLLKEDKARLLEIIEQKSLELILRERALGEISDKLKL